MTEQEFVEGLAQALYGDRKYMTEWRFLSDDSTLKIVYRERAMTAITYLHSQGVVIKVDKQLPLNLYGGGEDGDFLYYSELIEKGILSVVEPLIKEGLYNNVET